METGEPCCLKWWFSLTLYEIPWHFSSILPNVKISLTLCKIPWQFPDLENFYFSLTFPWRLWTLNEPVWHSTTPWWLHDMETLSTRLALYDGNPPSPVDSPHKGANNVEIWRSYVFSLNKLKITTIFTCHNDLFNSNAIFKTRISNHTWISVLPDSPSFCIPHQHTFTYFHDLHSHHDILTPQTRCGIPPLAKT